MKTTFAKSSDGFRIAYDISGSGKTLLLTHGGGSSRGELSLMLGMLGREGW
jgi:pimeloyl-ACP methyl ester carboxylesterase